MRTSDQRAVSSVRNPPMADARDVTAEFAALSGRGRNGRPSSVTESMRRTLPGADTNQRDMVNPFELLKSGGSEALAEAVRNQAREEQATIDRQTRDAQRRYEADLRRIREGRGVDAEDDRADPQRNYDDGADEPVEIDDYGAVWPKEGIAPPRIPTVVAAAPAPSSPVSARALTDADVDLVWDWIRVDAEGAMAFFGRPFATSLQLHQYFDAFNTPNPGAAVRALTVNGKFAAILLLNPISQQQNLAMLHLYVAPQIRGDVTHLFPYVLSGARAIVGDRMKLAIYTPSRDAATMINVLTRFGFVSYTTFVLDPQAQK